MNVMMMLLMMHEMLMHVDGMNNPINQIILCWKPYAPYHNDDKGQVTSAHARLSVPHPHHHPRTLTAP